MRIQKPGDRSQNPIPTPKKFIETQRPHRRDISELFKAQATTKG